MIVQTSQQKGGSHSFVTWNLKLFVRSNQGNNTCTKEILNMSNMDYKLEEALFLWGQLQCWYQSNNWMNPEAMKDGDVWVLAGILQGNTLTISDRKCFCPTTRNSGQHGRKPPAVPIAFKLNFISAIQSGRVSNELWTSHSFFIVGFQGCSFFPLGAHYLPFGPHFFVTDHIILASSTPSFGSSHFCRSTPAPRIPFFCWWWYNLKVMLNDYYHTIVWICWICINRRTPCFLFFP